MKSIAPEKNGKGKKINDREDRDGKAPKGRHMTAQEKALGQGDPNFNQSPEGALMKFNYAKNTQYAIL
ncbi:MAG: hypothetical protein K9N46_14375 [Candidatus Marinimicrobia bacterium]|nr:hypothetical protein [Candidatus Neomarinimicrobiota bacterium]MCF7830045.1 hypothetical protein [Candidatus Neomarinimicrobiota bacterium]MCF7881915.1 hypothetical protein [Candidatus Neomarinimicrobiota bacterium]